MFPTVDFGHCGCERGRLRASRSVRASVQQLLSARPRELPTLTRLGERLYGARSGRRYREVPSKRFDRRVLEEIDDSQFAAKAFLQAAMHLNDEQRVSPSSKKLSRTPTRSMPSTSRQISTSMRSRSFDGGAMASSSSRSAGIGSALRSTLPLPVIGSASRTITAAGTM